MRTFWLTSSESASGDRRGFAPKTRSAWPSDSLAEAQAAIARIRARGHHKIVVKQAFGVAGSNALRLFEPEFWRPSCAGWKTRLRANAGTGRRAVAGAGAGFFRATGNDRRRSETVRLHRPGQRRARTICGQLSRNRIITSASRRESLRCFREPADISRRLLAFYAEFLRGWRPSCAPWISPGRWALDAFVYRDAGGAVRLKPVVEINPRYTMGRVLVELMRQTLPEQRRRVPAGQRGAVARGGIRQIFRPMPARWRRNSRCNSKASHAAHPGGRLCLNEPATAQVCLAVFHVGRALEPLLAPLLNMKSESPAPA